MFTFLVIIILTSPDSTMKKESAKSPCRRKKQSKGSVTFLFQFNGNIKIFAASALKLIFLIPVVKETTFIVKTILRVHNNQTELTARPFNEKMQVTVPYTKSREKQCYGRFQDPYSCFSTFVFLLNYFLYRVSNVKKPPRAI